MQPDQSEVIEFLSRPETYGQTSPVERVETHGAVVFLTADRAYKLKRAVKYSYLDYSTVELRRRFSMAELALNRRTAPELYLAVEAVTRRAEGGLDLGGTGEPVDWLVVMKRFDEDTLFDRLAMRGALDRRMIIALTDRIVAFHRDAEATPEFGGHAAMRQVLLEDIANLQRGVPDAFNQPAVDAVAAESTAALNRLKGLVDHRRAAGKVRRCHGDLHLRNICLIADVPTLFDAIEFNDRIACIDVLYDLAFLLMDLDHHRLPVLSNAVLNRYFDLAGEAEGDLAMVPFCVAQRAMIRAHVGIAAAAAQSDHARASQQIDLARGYLVAALAYLRPAEPRLVAVGGLSGTGKSTLAHGLAPELRGPVGARVLRSDVLRKRLAGVAPETRLPASAYGRESSARVYAALCAAARDALAAGFPVIVDAVFADPAERAAVAAVAAELGVPFTGLWLEAPPELLAERIAARRGDASDATVDVLHQQLGYDLGPLDWTRIDVSGDQRTVLKRAAAALA